VWQRLYNKYTKDQTRIDRANYEPSDCDTAKAIIAQFFKHPSPKFVVNAKDIIVVYTKSKQVHVEFSSNRGPATISHSDFHDESYDPWQNVMKHINKKFRNSINNDILEFRAKHNITSKQQHVDHDPPFSKLVDQFLALKGVSSDNYGWIYSDTVNNGKSLDLKFVDEWQQYHRANAQVRVLPSKENLAGAQKAKNERKQRREYAWICQSPLGMCY